MLRRTRFRIGLLRPTGAVRWRRCGVMVVAMGLAMANARAWAATGMAHRTTDPVAAIRLDVDTRWVGAAGYRPVRVTVTPLAAKPDDRVLDVDFIGRRNGVRTYDISVRQQFVVPAGSTRPVQATIPVPQHTAWSSYSYKVQMDGRELPRLGLAGAQNRTGEVGWAECFPALLVVGDTLPDSSRLAAHFPMQAYNQYGGATAQPGNQLPTAISQPVAELPERWIDYSSVDVVCIDLAQLAQLSAQRPEALEAISAWTAAGGNLWVFGVDESRLAGLDALLGSAGEADASKGAKARGWRKPSQGNYGRTIQGALSGQSGVIGDAYVDDFESVLKSDSGSVPVRRRGPGDVPFRLRPYELGMVVALATGDGFEKTTRAEWGWLLAEVGTDRWLWYQRHGLSVAQINDEYLDFLIPGVGLAPVTEFCILITLFALAIGPVNYYLLKRWRRLYLLVVTIPVGAATVTLLLFAYAILSDGLGTRVRARSVTQIDQRRGQAVCWSRLSYYAGLAPSGGLAFPQDVVVLPLEQTPPGAGRSYGSQTGLRQNMAWGDEQRLQSGFLAPRTPTQFVTVRSRPSRRGLEVTSVAGKPSVLNQLGTPIRQLLLCDENGNTYWADDVAADGKVTPAPIQLRDARARLAQTCVDHQPQAPEGAGGYSSRGMFGFSRRRYWMYGGSNSALVPPTQSSNRLEKALGVIGGRYPQGPDPLATPRTYVAVVEKSPEVAFGVPSAEQEESFHVIFGSW